MHDGCSLSLTWSYFLSWHTGLRLKPTQRSDLRLLSLRRYFVDLFIPTFLLELTRLSVNHCRNSSWWAVLFILKHFESNAGFVAGEIAYVVLVLSQLTCIILVSPILIRNHRRSGRLGLLSEPSMRLHIGLVVNYSPVQFLASPEHWSPARGCLIRL